MITQTKDVDYGLWYPAEIDLPEKLGITYPGWVKLEADCVSNPVTGYMCADANWLLIDMFSYAGSCLKDGIVADGICLPYGAEVSQIVSILIVFIFVIFRYLGFPMRNLPLVHFIYKSSVFRLECPKKIEHSNLDVS